MNGSSFSVNILTGGTVQTTQGSVSSSVSANIVTGGKGDPGAPGPAGTTDYTLLTNKPTLATVATSGSYSDLSNKPTIPTVTGTNTGDETTATIKTKLGITTLSGANTGDQDLSSYATTASVTTGLAGKANTTHTHAESDVTGLAADLASKQPTLVSATNIKTINGNSLLGSGDLTIAGGSGTDATTTAKGIVQLAGDLAGTAAAPTVPGLASKQATLISGTNIKTVGGTSLLGSGDIAVGGTGTVTSVSVTTANGVSGTVATASTTPAITVSLGAITPTSVAATGTVTGSNLSGTNTGDQTTVSGNAGTATTLATARTIGTLTGDVTSAGSTFNGSANNTNATTVTKINGTSLAALGTGILKNTTTTGVPSIAVAADFPTLNQNTTGTAANITGTLAVSQGGTGATVNTGTGNNVLATSPTLVTPNLGTPSAIVLTNATGFPTLNQNTTGTAASITGSITESQVTNLPADLAAKQATLVSGTNIKTINSTSLLGSGDIVISGGASAATFTTAGTVKQREYNVRDYSAVGDGTTDDTTAIQAALDAAATAGGGIVFAPRANYVVSNLLIDSYVELRGAGRGTVLTAKAGSTGYMIALKTPATTQQIHVRDITLTPNTGTMGGVYLDNTGFTSAIDPLHVLENIVVLSAGGDGFRFNTNMRELKVIGCYVHNAQGYGYYLAAGCTDSRFINNTVGPSTLHGFYIAGNNNSFVNCKAFWNGYNGSTWNATSNGFHVVSAAYNMFSACSAQQSALHGFHFAGNTRTTVTGCDADTNSAGTTTGVGFNTDSNTYCTFSANTGGNNGILTPGNQLYGIQVANVQTGTLFYGNTVNGTSGDFGYVSGYGYMLISGSIADFTGINTKLNSVSQFGLLGSTSGTTSVVPAAVASGTLTLPAATDTLVGQATTDTLTNKTLTAPTLSGTVAGTYTLGGTPTFPSTVVLTTGAQTLTSKTLTSPIISTISNTGTLTLPTSTDTLVGRATTDSLTNKAITPRVGTTTTATTITPTAGSFDLYQVTALTTAVTVASPGAGSNGQKMMLRFKSAAAQTITWNAIFVSSGIATLPTTTVAGKTITVGVVYDSGTSTWVALAVDATGY